MMSDLYLILLGVYLLIGIGIASAMLRGIADKLAKEDVLYAIVAFAFAAIICFLWPAFVAYVLFTPTSVKR